MLKPSFASKAVFFEREFQGESQLTAGQENEGPADAVASVHLSVQRAGVSVAGPD